MDDWTDHRASAVHCRPSFCPPRSSAFRKADRSGRSRERGGWGMPLAGILIELGPLARRGVEDRVIGARRSPP
jgi:hypothetical protein